MSGGTFQYKEYKLAELACDLQEELLRCDAPTSALNPAVVKAIKRMTKQLIKLHKQVRAVDYFFAGDIGEESLLAQLKEIK